VKKDSLYTISLSGSERIDDSINWRGLLPNRSAQLPNWVNEKIEEIRKWAQGVRYLKCPRIFSSSHMINNDNVSYNDQSQGMNASMSLINDSQLRASVQEWYKNAFDIDLFVRKQGRYSDLVVRSSIHNHDVLLDQSGEGLSQVLPVVIMSLTAENQCLGVDIIEHPSAELHPASHAHVADLLLSKIKNSLRPTVIETHSEMMLLRTRRRIAEGLVDPKDIIVYWVDNDQEDGSFLKKLEIDEYGQMSEWPSGVFIEDYEEIIAMRRAVRMRKETSDAHRN